jgi:diguanylate cyclase (GGDEF)-like protein
MSETRPLLRQPLNSLATKIIFVVFLSTSLTAVVVSWISVHSTYTFLERRIQASYPAILERTAERLAGWLREAEVELAEHASQPDPAARPALEAWVARSARFDGAALADAHGRVLAQIGQDPWPETLPRPALKPGAAPWVLHGGEDGPRIVVAVAVGGTGEALLLHGALRRNALGALLASDGLGAAGRIALVGPDDHVLLASPAVPVAGADPSARALEGLAAGGVVEYAGPGGRHMIGTLRALPGSPLRLVLEEPFEKAFEPVFAVVTRVFVIDLCIILAFSFLAYQVTAAIVQPIERLSEGARRISQGDFEVELVETRTRDEIGLLTHAFNEMTHKLLAHRAEIESANQKLLAQNEALQRANEVLEQLSITDGLTKLHNHRFFQDHLTREIKRVSRTGELLSMLICDIDDFKRLNDRLGHASGDELLIGIARVLNDSIRETDFLARYGGEEFVVLAPGTDLAGAVTLAEKIREAVAAGSYILDSTHQLTKVTVSIGVAQYSGSRKRFFQAADQALYRAKAAGKNCVMAEGDIGQVV